jgi:uncharacterized protein (DUF362 family)
MAAIGSVAPAVRAQHPPGPQGAPAVPLPLPVVTHPATHADTLRGILDYLGPRFKGPVIVAEASSGNTLDGFENFKYRPLIAEYRSLNVELIDLNREGKYVTSPLIDTNLQMFPVRLAARLMDPDAFIVSASIPKTHDCIVATMGVKNMVMGAPLHSPVNGPDQWNDKMKLHTGIKQPPLGLDR